MLRDISRGERERKREGGSRHCAFEVLFVKTYIVLLKLLRLSTLFFSLILSVPSTRM